MPPPPPPDMNGVRAEGRVAAAAAAANRALRAKTLCRCVFRGKDARQDLQAFDCDHCRAFYEAVGDAGKGAARLASCQEGPKASRHRFERAPVNTPQGFWDLSFPRQEQ